MLKTTSLVATAALIAGGILAVLTSHSAGAATAYPSNCATATSPFAGAPQPVVYGRPGLSVRRFTKPGRSPLFVAAANTRYVSTGPLLTPTVADRRQIRSMLGTAYAGVNGDFFTSFGAVGVEVARGGRVVKGTSGLSWALVTRPDQSVTVAQVQLTLHLNRKLSAASVATLGFQTFNGPQAPANGIDVFTNWSNGTLIKNVHWATQPARTYLLYRGHVAAVYSGAHARSIPSGGALVVVQGGALSKVTSWRVGSTIGVSVSAHSPTVPHVWASVGSGGPLVHASRAWSGACGYDAASPRTVAAVRGSSVYLVTASGHGLTSREMMAFLRGLGVSEAIGMDGGGSTVMVVRQSSGPQQLTVHPYVNEGDRPVPNGIGLWHR